jgi:hypothetical protein
MHTRNGIGADWPCLEFEGVAMRLTKSEALSIGMVAVVAVPLQVWVIVASFREGHPVRFKALVGSILFWLWIVVGVWLTKRFGKSKD